MDLLMKKVTIREVNKKAKSLRQAIIVPIKLSYFGLLKVKCLKKVLSVEYLII